MREWRHGRNEPPLTPLKALEEMDHKLRCMTIEVAQEDRDLVMAIAMLVNDTGMTIPERLKGAEELCSRHRMAAYEKGYRAAHMEILIKDSGDIL